MSKRKDTSQSITPTVSNSRQEASKRKSLPSRPVIKGVGHNHRLQAIEPNRRIHACFFKPETTIDLIKSHMEEFKVDKLKLRHDSYL